MKSSLSSGSHLTRCVALSGLLCVALAASTAHACPPGTMPDPNYNPSSPGARAHPQRCVPAPKPTAKYAGTINPNIEQAKPHSAMQMQQDHSKVKPQPGAPIQTANSDADGHCSFTSVDKSKREKTPVAFVARNGDDDSGDFD